MNISMFRDARYSYLSYLQAGGIEPEIFKGPFRPRQAGDIRPRSSELGRCPLRVVHEIQGTEPTHPNQLLSNQPDLLHKFRSGHTCADEWRRTLAWYGGGVWRIENEVPCDDEQTTGTIDTLITLPSGIKYVVDYKRTNQLAVRSREGHLHNRTDFIQLADYIRKMQDIQPGQKVFGALLRDYQSSFRVFWMEPQPFGVGIFEENGALLDTITDKELSDSIARSSSYLNGLETEPPYEHPLQQWRCVGAKNGNTYQVGCPFFGNCWKISAAEINVVDGKIWNDEGECYYTGESNG